MFGKWRRCVLVKVSVLVIAVVLAVTGFGVSTPSASAASSTADTEIVVSRSTTPLGSSAASESQAPDIVSSTPEPSRLAFTGANSALIVLWIFLLFSGGAAMLALIRGRDEEDSLY